MLVTIGKILLVVVGSAVILAFVAAAVVVIWLAYEQANGRNPFQ